MLSSFIALTPSLNGPAALSSVQTLRVAAPVMQFRDHSREPIQPPGWRHDFKLGLQAVSPISSLALSTVCSRTNVL